MPPVWLVTVPFIVAFCLAVWQYYRLDPARRVLNLPFAVTACAAAVVVVYPLYAQLSPGNGDLAWTLLILGIVWMGLGWWMRRYVNWKKKRN